MTPAALEALVLPIALPPLKVARRERYLEMHRRDPAAVVVAAEELATIARSPSGARALLGRRRCCDHRTGRARR